MDHHELITDGLSRGRGVLRRAVTGMSPEALAYRPAEHTNPIGWLAWHIARVEDMHIADLLEVGQLWTDGGWHDRFGMPADARDFGTRQTLEQVNAVKAPTAELLLSYYDAVAERTDAYLATLSAESGLSSAPTMGLPSRLERLMLDAAGLGVGVGNDQLFFRNERVSEMPRHRRS